jgi:hypothetical protein
MDFLPAAIPASSDRSPSIPSQGLSHSYRVTLLIFVVSLLGIVPVWLSYYPPMVDLPQHGAQIALLRNLHDPGFRFAGLFQVNWFTPYLFGYMVVYALAPVLGIVAACKVVISLALVGMPLATERLMQETGADRYWALLTIPAMYGVAFEWGFLNFLVAAPLGLILLLLSIRYVRRPTLRDSLWLALFTCLLFFCHALVCVFFGIIACLYALAETRQLKKAAIAILPLAAVTPIMLAWYIRTKSQPMAQQSTVWDLGWFDSSWDLTSLGRVNGFFPRLLGIKAGAICNVFGAALFCVPFLAGARPLRRLAVWIPLCVCAGVLLFAPATLFGATFVFHRFTIFALPLFMLGIGGGTRHRVSHAAVAIVLIAWFALVANRTLQYAAEAKDLKQIVSAMEPNERALSLVFVPYTQTISAPVLLHLPAWYSAVKEGVVDVNFALFPVELVQYRADAQPAAQIGFENQPETFSWYGWNGSAYRYFVVHAPEDLLRRLFGRAPCRLRLVARSNDWWLYEKPSPCTFESNFP